MCNCSVKRAGPFLGRLAAGRCKGSAVGERFRRLKFL